MRSIAVGMSRQTVAALLAGGFRLLAFKAVGTDASGTVPLVWYETGQFSLSTVLSWPDDLSAYASQSGIVPGVPVAMDMTTGVATGEVAEIQNGAMTTKTGGPFGLVMIANEDRQLWTAGIAQAVDGVLGPYCAVPLHPAASAVLKPANQILLMFAPLPAPAGTAFTNAPAAGLLIDMAGALNANVSFDISAGWSGSGRQVAHGADLVSLLILE